MELDKVTKIVELSRQYDANEYLALGWKMLCICKNPYGLGNTEVPYYVLGWLDGKPVYPKPEDRYASDSSDSL